MRAFWKSEFWLCKMRVLRSGRVLNRDEGEVDLSSKKGDGCSRGNIDDNKLKVSKDSCAAKDLRVSSSSCLPVVEFDKETNGSCPVESVLDVKECKDLNFNGNAHSNAVCADVSAKDLHDSSLRVVEIDKEKSDAELIKSVGDVGECKELDLNANVYTSGCSVAATKDLHVSSLPIVEGEKRARCELMQSDGCEELDLNNNVHVNACSGNGVSKDTLFCLPVNEVDKERIGQVGSELVESSRDVDDTHKLENEFNEELDKKMVESSEKVDNSSTGDVDGKRLHLISDACEFVMELEPFSSVTKTVDAENEPDHMLFEKYDAVGMPMNPNVKDGVDANDNQGVNTSTNINAYKFEQIVVKHRRGRKRKHVEIVEGREDYGAERMAKVLSLDSTTEFRGRVLRSMKMVTNDEKILGYTENEAIGEEDEINQSGKHTIKEEYTHSQLEKNLKRRGRPRKVRVDDGEVLATYNDLKENVVCEREEINNASKHTIEKENVEYKLKKRRGRPPKVKKLHERQPKVQGNDKEPLVTTCDQSSKHLIETECVFSEKKLKKKRGRPPKVKVNDGEPLVTNCDQSSKHLIKTENVFSEEKLKKRRGRPPKAQVINNKSLVTTSESKEKVVGEEEATNQLSNHIVKEKLLLKTKLKRGRGRPPKSLCSNSEALISPYDLKENVGEEVINQSSKHVVKKEYVQSKKNLSKSCERQPKVQMNNEKSCVTTCDLKEYVEVSREDSELQKVEKVNKAGNLAKMRKESDKASVMTKVIMKSSDNDFKRKDEKLVCDPMLTEKDYSNRQINDLHHGIVTVGENVLKTSKQEMGRKEEKHLLREQIICMLQKAGWTIQYRPRQNREYNDAVYVDLEGHTHWSVTKAYRRLKNTVEVGCADSKAISAFTPIPEEVLSTLYRTIRRKKVKDKSKSSMLSSRNKSSKNKSDTKGSRGLKRKGKPASCFLSGGKFSSKKMKGNKSHSAPENLVGMSKRRAQRVLCEGRQRGKRCGLLARKANELLDMKGDDFVAYIGKCSTLSWMIGLGTISSNGKVKYMNSSRTSVLLEGIISRDGICCCCCDKTFTLKDFQFHAVSTQQKPFENIYLDSGTSLLKCLEDTWSKEVNSKQVGFCFVDLKGDDPNDDTCNICGDGGKLICCDGCPSTFHQSCLNIMSFPSGAWNCIYCSCKFCGAVCKSTSQSDEDVVHQELLRCSLCEENFHRLCLNGDDLLIVSSTSNSFCGRKCEEIFEQLHALLGVRNELEEGFSWTLLKRYDIISEDTSLADKSLKIECNSKLAVAKAVMDECFIPIVDERSGINMIHNVVYNCGSNLTRLNYSGFFTVVLESGDEMISAACIRIHGNQLVEMPFIGTRYMYRRQGMCRRLLNAIESILCSIGVEKLVIPAIAELLQTWTSVFGFMSFENGMKSEMKFKNMVVFPRTDMLEKPLLKQFSDEVKKLPASDLRSDGIETTCRATLDEASCPDAHCCTLPDVCARGTSELGDDDATVKTDIFHPCGPLIDDTDVDVSTCNAPEHDDKNINSQLEHGIFGAEIMRNDLTLAASNLEGECTPALKNGEVTGSELARKVELLNCDSHEEKNAETRSVDENEVLGGNLSQTDAECTTRRPFDAEHAVQLDHNLHHSVTLEANLHHHCKLQEANVSDVQFPDPYWSCASDALKTHAPEVVTSEAGTFPES